jgi:ribosome maturation factor RimP
MNQTELLLWSDTEKKIYALLSPTLNELGYRLIAIDTLLSPESKLVLYIDFAPLANKAIGIEDCIKVNKAINPTLDSNPEFAKIFNGPYELEVSSPGVERPLKQRDDFKTFQGHRARIHLTRPLTPEEIKNEAYLSSNPTQKNFLGNLRGIEEDQLHMGIPREAKKNQIVEESVWIPIGLITKAHLEPEFKIKGRK